MAARLRVTVSWLWVSTPAHAVSTPPPCWRHSPGCVRSAALRLQLVYVWADESTLLRRYTETRRRHPLAPLGIVADGIAAEIALTEPLREEADLVVDTSDLPIANLRHLIERHFGADATHAQMAISLVSFAYPKGLPREADLVFDARFLRNPYYDPILRNKSGLDPDVGSYIEADPDYPTFFSRIAELMEFILPRFVQEGKKYATITIGCTGGRHRSVHLIEKLANHLTSRAVTRVPRTVAAKLFGECWSPTGSWRGTARPMLF